MRVKKRSLKDKSKRKEFDAIAACEGIFIINETKSAPEIRDVDKLAEFIQSNELFDYFPEYKGCNVYPVFSSLFMEENFIKYLTGRGIYALTLKDDTMEIINYDAFRNMR